MFVSFFQLPGPMPTKRIKLWSPVIDPGARSAFDVRVAAPSIGAQP
jgi:hypothetical protein